MKKALCLILILVLAFLSGCGKGDTETSSGATGDESKTVSGDASGETSFDETTIQGLIDKYSHFEYQTDKPVIVDSLTVTDGRAVISGYCEENSEVYLVEKGNITQKITSYKGTYIIEIILSEKETSKEVDIYAITEGKAVSRPVQTAVSYKNYVECEYQHYVRVGKAGWLFFTNTEPQYTNNEGLSENRKSRIISRIQSRVSNLSQQGTKIIYVLIPNPNEIYSEYMPEEIIKGTVSYREEIASALSEGGATVIDMGETLKNLKGGEFELYHRTDSHWTEYAAYFAYKAICEQFASDGFSGASPRDISEFGFKNERRAAGDLYFDLGLDETSFKTHSTFSDITFETPVDLPKYSADDRSRINDDCMEYMEFHNSAGQNKPSVLMMRDSYSIMLFDWLAERCGSSYFKPLWEFQFDANEISSLGVDYVIYFITDMNLNSIIR